MKTMNAPTYLQKQLANLNAVFHGITGDLTDEEWTTRPAPGQNMIGYTVWHMPRAQDSFVQTWIRGIPEVAHGERWAHWQTLKHLGIGVGISLDEADGIARSVKKSDVFEYADAVHQEISAWLEKINESDLDQVNNTQQCLSSFPEYQTPGFLDDVKNLINQPAWTLLMRPCIGHIHRHLGELEIVKTILRTNK
jgi:DinB superfamily